MNFLHSSYNREKILKGIAGIPKWRKVQGLVFKALLTGLAKARMKLRAISEAKPNINVKFWRPENIKE